NIDAASGNAFAGGPVSGRAIELVGTCTACEIERNTLLAAKGIVSSVEGAGTGAINGNVMDGTGAVIAAASVTAAGSGGTSPTATTDGQGKFSFPSLSPDTYLISAKIVASSSA